MRILFMFDGLGCGGRERRFVQLIKGLNKNEYNDLYLINTRNIIEYEEIFDYNIHIELINRHKKGFYYSFIKRINEIKPDVIQPWTDVNALHLDIAYFFLQKKPIYISSFIADCNYFKHSLWSKCAMRVAYWLSRYVISNSVAGLNSYKVTDQEKRICIHNGFDFERLLHLQKCNIKKELKIETKFIVSMIARMVDNKDFPMYIKAAHEVLKQRDDVTFLAVGTGPLEKTFREEVPVEIMNKVIFTGRRNDIDNILHVTDISVLCTNSEIHGEGISNTILESMASSVPVIATVGGGTSEIVDDGKTGFLIPSKNHIVLSQKIMYLLNNDGIRKQMGKVSEDKIRKEFSLETTTKQYIDLYESLNLH